MRQHFPRTLVRLLQWSLVVALLAWALRGISLVDIGRVLSRLGIAQLAALLALNLLILWSFTWRWWAVLRALGYSIPTRLLAVYRLAAFAVSYLTPGPQFGGEPLQVFVLSRRQALPTSTAIASVVLDKTLELISSFTFLIVGVVAVLRLNLIPVPAQTPLLALSLVLLSLPAAYLAFSCRGARPATWLLGRFPAAARRWPGYKRFSRSLAEGEIQVGRLCREQSTWLLVAIALSGISWVFVLAEAWMAMQFLGITLGPAQAIGVVAAGRLAFLLPFPGGLGALEVSQILAVGALGFSRTDGVALGLLIRSRDLLLAGVGAWLAVILAPELRAVGGPDRETDDL